MEDRVFLSYSREDQARVEVIYDFLSAHGFSPWMDTRDLKGGEQWEPAIKKAIRNSRLFLACLSESSIGKKGVLDTERQDALEILGNLPGTGIFLIPVRLDRVELIEDLRKFQWVDWFEDDCREKILAAIREAFARQASGIQSLSIQRTSIWRPVPAALAMDLKFLYRGGADEILHMQSEHDFDIRTEESKRRAIDQIERALPHDRSRLNSFICLLGDHLRGRYDFFSIEQLLGLMQKHRWSEDRYLVVNKRIGAVQHDHASLSLWFNGVLTGGATDIVEIQYESRSPDALQLSRAMNRSMVRHQKRPGIAAHGKWKVSLSDHSPDLAAFLDEFRAPRDYRGNIIVVIDNPNQASQTRLVNATMEKNPDGQILIATVDVDPSKQLKNLCIDQGLASIDCRGPFELRYFLLTLEQSQQ